MKLRAIKIFTFNGVTFQRGDTIPDDLFSLLINDREHYGVTVVQYRDPEIIAL